jgi:hypothetical protein
MAIITNATRKVVIDHVVATLGRAPTTAELADITVLLNDGASLADVAGYLTSSAAYLAKYPLGQTASEVGADILDAAIVGGVLADDIRLAVIDLIAGGLNSGAYTIATATNAVVAYLSDPANNDNADLGDIAKAFQNRTAAAEEFTTTFTLAGATVSAADLSAALEGVTSDAATLTAAKTAFANGNKTIAAQAAADKAAADAAAAKAAEEKAAADKAAADKAAEEKAAADKAAADKAAADAAAAADALKKTLALTSTLDSLKGGDYDDTFNGVVQDNGGVGSTAAPGDVIAGGAGTDTLNLSFAGNGAGYTLQALQATGVENVLVNNFDTNNATTTTIDTALMSGVNKVGLSASSATGDTVFSGMTAIKDAQMTNGSGDLTLTYAAGVSGTADTQNLAISNVSGGTFTANGLETVAISGSLTANKLTNVAGSTLTKITVSGDQNFTMTGSTAVPTIDASENTGKTSLTVSAAAGGVGSTITLGSGDDTLDVGTSLSPLDKIQGGDGTDTIKISVGAQIYNGGTTVASTSEFIQSGGFEVIDIASTDDTATLDVKDIAGVETVKAAANVGTFALAGTNESVGDTVTFTLNGKALTSGALTSTAADATTDSIEEVVAATINAQTGFTAVATADTVTVTNTSGTSEIVELTDVTYVDAGATLQVGGGAAAVGSLTFSGGYKDVTVQGITSQEVDIYSADKVTVRMVDSSGTEDVLSVNLKSTSTDKAVAQTIGELDVADTIETLNLDATGMKTGVSSVLKTLTTLSADSSLTTLNITGSDDLTISNLTATKLATINASTATGSISLPGTGSLAQTITFGSGNDTLVMAGNLTAADVIDMGANSIAVAATGALGQDTITTTGNIGTAVTAAALQISNAEVVTISGTANYIDGSKLSNVGLLAFSNGSGSSTLTNMPAGTAIGLGVVATESASTYTVSLADATGTEDALSLVYGSGIDQPTANTLLVAGVETLNIKASAEKATGVTSTLNLTNAAVSTINVTGGHSGDTTALGTLNKATSSVQAGTNSGAISLVGAAGYAMNVSANGSVVNNITLSTKADTVTLTKELGTTRQVIDGGATASAATADTLNATVSNVATDFRSVAGFEVMNLTVKSATATGFNDATSDDGLNGTSLAVVNILGGNANSTFVVGNAANFNDGRTALNPLSVSSASFNGSVDLTFASDALDSFTTVTGGSSSSDHVRTVIAAATGNSPTMSGVEQLTVTSTDTDTDAAISLAKVTGLTKLNTTFTGGTADGITVTGLAAGVPVYASSNVTNDALTLTLASATGSEDALSVVVMANTGTLDLNAAGVETLSLISGGAAGNVGGTIDLAGVAPTTGSATTVNLSGGAAFTLTAINTGINNINASALGGALDVSADQRDSDAITITGGAADDTIAMENIADVLSGGNQAVGGADKLVVNYAAVLAGITVDLSAADQVVSMDGSPNTAVQTGFESVDLRAFSGFGAVVTGSDGANVITGTAGVDRIDAGKGNDTIVIATNTAGDTDQINGGTGTDTVSVLAGTYTPAANANIVSVENITLTGTAGVDATALTGNYSYTGGAGANVITLGSGVSTVTLAGGNDVVRVTELTNGTATGVDKVTFAASGFTVGNGNDQVELTVTAVEGILGGSNDLVLAGLSTTSVAGATNVVITATGAGAYDLENAATTAIVAIETNAADDAAAEALIVTGGTHALTVNGAMAAGDQILALYDDGSNSYLAVVETGAIINDNGSFVAADTTVTTIVTFVGVADHTTLDATNFDFI